MSEAESMVGGAGEDITASIEVVRYVGSGVIFKVLEQNSLHALVIPERPEGDDDFMVVPDPYVYRDGKGSTYKYVDNAEGVYAEVDPTNSPIKVISTDEHGLSFVVGRAGEEYRGNEGWCKWRVYYSDIWEKVISGFAVRGEAEKQGAAGVS